MRTVELPELSDLDGVDPTKLELLLTMADRAQCQIEAMLAEIADVCQSTRAYRGRARLRQRMVDGQPLMVG